MNRDVLVLLLDQAFGGSDAERRVVARAAGDLADFGRYEDDADATLSPQRVVQNMADAPDKYGVVERWNWWVGALDVAHGGYETFLVRRWEGEN